MTALSTWKTFVAMQPGVGKFVELDAPSIAN